MFSYRRDQMLILGPDRIINELPKVLRYDVDNVEHKIFTSF